MKQYLADMWCWLWHAGDWFPTIRYKKGKLSHVWYCPKCEKHR